MNDPNRIAVVTGANKGIGLEVVHQLADRGFHVILAARDVQRGRAARERLEGRGRRVSFCPLDVTSDESVDGLRRYLETEHGRLDVLVNNAGVALDKFVPALDLELETLRATFEVNVFGAFRVSKALVPVMKKTGAGRIVMLSSMLGSLEKMGGLTLAYRMSKTSLNALTRVLAAELADARILVNAVCPGWVRTDLGGPDAPVSPEEGARRVVELALLPEGGPTGAFFRDGEAYPW